MSSPVEFYTWCQKAICSVLKIRGKLRNYLKFVHRNKNTPIRSGINRHEILARRSDLKPNCTKSGAYVRNLPTESRFDAPFSLFRKRKPHRSVPASQDPGFRVPSSYINFSVSLLRSLFLSFRSSQRERSICQRSLYIKSTTD